MMLWVHTRPTTNPGQTKRHSRRTQIWPSKHITNAINATMNGLPTLSIYYETHKASTNKL